MNKRTDQNLQFNKIVIISMVGNVGKSTTLDTLISPRMPDAAVYRIETINSTKKCGAKKEMFLRGDQIDKLQIEVAKDRQSIVDVGMSNVEKFAEGMNEQYGSHQLFDCFLVPVLAKSGADKETEDAIKTLLTLHQMGIAPANIKVMFNKLPRNSTVDIECEDILNFHEANPIFTLNKEAVIYQSDAFKALGEVDRTFAEMIVDDTDYYAALNNIPMDQERERVKTIKMARAQGTCKKLNMELEVMFKVLFGG